MHEMKLIFIGIFIYSAFILNGLNASFNQLALKTWILSCVPCEDILNECAYCLKDNCVSWYACFMFLN